MTARRYPSDAPAQRRATRQDIINRERRACGDNCRLDSISDGYGRLVEDSNPGVIDGRQEAEQVMNREYEIAANVPRYARVRANRELRNRTGLEAPQAHTTAEL